jgi:hypothetical protein
MALDLMRLAALGILPTVATGAVASPDASDSNPGPSKYPVKDGKDPLAPLSGRAQSNLTQPWRSDALLAFGAGMLSGHNFFDGLAKGATAAQDARHSYENPQRHLLANGAFTLEEYPDGTTKLQPNKDVQDYQTLQTEIGYMGKAALQQANAKAIADRMAADNDAMLARTKAQIDASDRRTAAQIQAQNERHDTDAELKRQEIEGTVRDPFTKAYLENQGKAAADIPDVVQKASGYIQGVDSLLGMVATQGADGKWKIDPQKAASVGLGVGLGQKVKRGLAAATGEGLGTGVDPDKLSRAKYLINNVILNNNPFKGQGQVSNYEERMRMAASPSLEMGPQAFLQALLDRRNLATQGITFAKSLYQKAQDEAAKRHPSHHGVTSGQTSAGLPWKIVSPE